MEKNKKEIEMRMRIRKNIGGKREEKERKSRRNRGKSNGENGGKKERGRGATGKKEEKNTSRWVRIQYYSCQR